MQNLTSNFIDSSTPLINTGSPTMLAKYTNLRESRNISLVNNKEESPVKKWLKIQKIQDNGIEEKIFDRLKL